MAANPNASDNQSLTDQLYLHYKDAGQTSGMIVPALALNLFSTIGIVLNSLVVYVTARSSNLRGTAHFLLAITCFLEVTHQAGHYNFLYIALTGQNFIDYFTSVKREMLSMFSVSAIQLLIASTGIDRLLCVTVPRFYRNLNNEPAKKITYLAIIMLFTLAYGFGFCYYCYVVALRNAELPVTGLISDLFSIEIGIVFFPATVLINFLGATCYVIIWIIMRKSTAGTSDKSKKLLKSLVVILCANIGGYFINLALLQLIVILLKGDMVRMWHVMFINNTLLNIAAGSNAPILYMLSTDYRKAFQTHLTCLFKGNGSRVTNISTNPNRSRTSKIDQRLSASPNIA